LTVRFTQLRLVLPLLLIPVVAHPGPAAEIVIHGQIRADGRPLARARVELFPLVTAYEKGRKRLGDPPPAARAGILTDAAGQFLIVAPESGMWTLQASAPGYVPMEFPLFPLTEETDLPAVELPRDTGRQARVLTDKGAPVAGARVLTTPIRVLDAFIPWIPSWEPAEQLGVTDVDGRVTLPGSGESLRVAVRAEGHPIAVLSGVSASRLEVRISRGSEQRILVRDPKGRPAGGVLAWVEGEEIPAALSDPQGRLTLSLPAGKKWAVRFLGLSGERAEADLAPRPEAASKPVTVDLRAPDVLSGRVLSLPGLVPVPGALVWLGRDFTTFVRTDRTGRYALALGPTGPVRAAATGYFEDVFQGPQVSPGPSFALRPKSFLPGSVADERGRPLAGVEIKTRYEAAAVRWADSTLRFSGGLTRSRDTGLFRVDRLVPGAAYTLRFAKEGFAPGVIQVKAPEPGVPPEPLRIVLSAGLKAGGFIRDRQDKPVPGAVVELQPSIPSDAVARLRLLRDPDPALSRKTATDGNGRFDLLNVAPGTFDLLVRASGFATARVPGIEVPDGRSPVDLGTVVLESEAAVTGVVRSSEGQPLEGAGIRIVPSEPLPGNSQGEPDAVSDAAGRFAIRGQRSGVRLKLSAERPGYAPAQVSGVAAPTEDVVFVLSPRGRITGRVVASDARPVAGVALQAISVKTETFGGMAIQGGAVVEARSHEDGTFAIDGVEPGPIELTGSGPEWQESSLQLRLPAGQDLEGVELVLHKAALLEGQVLGPDGNPVARAEIGRYLPPRPGEIRYEAPLAFSDAEGRYRIGSLAPGRLSFAARHAMFGEAVREIDAQPGANTLDFELSGGQTVSGRVVDPSGYPVAEARVSLRSSSWAAGPSDAVSEADGSFHFEGISPGSYRLEAQKENEGRTRQPVPVTVAEAPLDGIVLELEPAGTIHGRILGLNVDELAQVQLSAGWEAGVSAVAYDGSYSITDLAPGVWRVVAELPRTGRRAEGEVTLESGADAELDLDFESGLTLTGRLRKNGQAFAGATVTLSGQSPAPAFTETGPEGRFELRGLIPGLYRLEISDYRTGIFTARQVQLQQDQDIVLDLETARLDGVVLDTRDRLPLGNVELTLSSLDGGGEGVVDRRAVSSAGGEFSFAEVAEGSWKLTANRPGYTPKEQVLSLGSTPQRIEVLLDPAPGLAQVVPPP
jgi:protocatechuate 3,4-dioxygenase beta subunit